VIFGGYFTFQVSKDKKKFTTKKNHWSVPGFLKKTKGFSPWQKKNWQKKNWAVQASSGQTLFSTSPFDFFLKTNGFQV
jgi:hypothetical protein